jgi:hypothetical protein
LSVGAQYQERTAVGDDEGAVVGQRDGDVDQSAGVSG